MKYGDRGVAMGWTSTPLSPEAVPEIDANPGSLVGVGIDGNVPMDLFTC